jgi:hypothetical protein
MKEVNKEAVVLSRSPVMQKLGSTLTRGGRMDVSEEKL